MSSQLRSPVSPMNYTRPLVDPSLSPYRPRRKSSLSRNPFSSFMSERMDSPDLEETKLTPHENKRCFRCQKLIDQDDIKIGPTINSSIVTLFYIEDSSRLSISPISNVSSVFSTPFASPNSSYSGSPSTLFLSKKRRRSSLPLTASFQESLLTGRTSGVPSNPISFTAKLVISEFDPVTDRPIISNREYGRNTIQFDAIYYNWQENEEDKVTKESPYVGTIDLDKSFIEREISKLDDSNSCSSKRSFPGHILPECFIIQLLLVNDQENLSDCLVFKFNLLSENLHNGEKTFLRKSSFVLHRDEKQFVSTIQINIAKVKNKYILFNNIKVIFHNKVLPIMSNDDVSASLAIKHSEILKGGKSKLNLALYKKCTTCNLLDEKLLYLKSLHGADGEVIKSPDIHINQQRDNTPPSVVSKRLVFGNYEEVRDNYQDSSVFDDDDDDEDEDENEESESMLRRKSSISFRNKRRESFMF